MSISQKLLNYFDVMNSKSTQKNHTRFRNDICNHWDLYYMSAAELEARLSEDVVETTISRKKQDLP